VVCGFISQAADLDEALMKNGVCGGPEPMREPVTA